MIYHKNSILLLVKYKMDILTDFTVNVQYKILSFIYESQMTYFNFKNELEMT